MRRAAAAAAILFLAGCGTASPDLFEIHRTGEDRAANLTLVVTLTRAACAVHVPCARSVRWAIRSGPTVGPDGTVRLLPRAGAVRWRAGADRHVTGGVCGAAAQ